MAKDDEASLYSGDFILRMKLINRVYYPELEELYINIDTVRSKIAMKQEEYIAQLKKGEVIDLPIEVPTLQGLGKDLENAEREFLEKLSEKIINI